MKGKLAWLSGCLGTILCWAFFIDAAGYDPDLDEMLPWLLPLLWTVNLIIFRPVDSETAQLEVDIQKQELRLQIERNRAALVKGSKR